jgi:4-amino-4-deoxy-L-arabinose transferase-like glycosyltransferase
MRTSDLSAAPGFFARIRKSQLETAGLVLLLLYVVAGLIYSAVVPPVPRFTDEQEYLKLSYNLLHGPGFSLDGVHLTASRPPGYPVFLAAIRELGGGFFSFRAAQFLLQGATLLLLARLGADVKPAASLLIIVVLVICYPVLFYVGATLYPQIVSGFLFILSLTLLLRTPRGLMSNAVTGLVFAALILTVPTFLFTLFVVL